MSSGGAVLLARLLICVVLGVAGCAKLADLAGFRRSLVGFGIPAVIAPPVAWLVPLAELACAAALLTPSRAWWGAIGASALISAFLLAIVGNLMLGRTPDCRCFGQVRVSRIGWTTVVRNGLLLGLSGFIVSRGSAGMGPGVDAAWIAVREGRFILPIWAIGLLGAWFFAAMWLNATLPASESATPRPAPAGIPHAGGTIPLPDPASTAPGLGLPLDALAPAFALNSLGGDVVSLDSLAESGTPLMLLFTRPNCPSCDAVLPDVGRWQREHGGRLLTLVISKGGFEANREKVSRFGLTDVLIQQQNEVFDAYGIQSLPSAVLVTDGRIVSPLAEGRDAIRALVADAVERDILKSSNPHILRSLDP